MTVDTIIIDGSAVARATREQVACDVARHIELTGARPGLATVLVGDDPASEVYIRNKRRSAGDVGIVDVHRHLAVETTQRELEDQIDELASDPAVSGILLQLPLPPHLDASQAIERIPWQKDVDGLTTTSVGLLARNQAGLRPCTPSGVLTLLDDAGIDLSGRRVVVVGRSELVGRPVAQMLIARDATVTVVHSRTRDTQRITREADVLVVAAGVPGLIGLEDVAPGAAVIDVGIHRHEGRLVGDVRCAELVGHAGWLTPVPGGVGPMTIAELLRNTVRAAALASTTGSSISSWRGVQMTE